MVINLHIFGCSSDFFLSPHYTETPKGRVVIVSALSTVYQHSLCTSRGSKTFLIKYINNCFTVGRWLQVHIHMREHTHMNTLSPLESVNIKTQRRNLEFKGINRFSFSYWRLWWWTRSWGNGTWRGVHGSSLKWFVDSKNCIHHLPLFKKERCVFKSHKTHTKGKVGY